MENGVYLFVLVLGISLGSFVNMLYYRTAIAYGLRKQKFSPKDKSRSFCDYCGTQLGWGENIPILSWVVQGGRSRCCHKKLPVSYPIVEILAGVLLVLMCWKFGIGVDGLRPAFIFQLIFGSVLVTLLLFAALFDLKYMILPDFSTLILIVVAILGVVLDEPNPLPYFLSAVGAFLFLLILHIATKGKGMGMGDVKFALFMGMFLGWPGVVVAFYVAFVTGALVGGSLMMAGKVKKHGQIAFGPFLIWGTIVSWLYGKEILNYFVSIF